VLSDRRWPGLVLSIRWLTPVLELHGSDGSLITTNDNWKAAQQSEIEATGLQPENDLEAAIVIGPSLTPFGVADALADPTLELHNASGDLAGSNDNWKSLQQIEIEATGLAPHEDAESAILQTLASRRSHCDWPGQERLHRRRFG
jgi:hypothetical protein